VGSVASFCFVFVCSDGRVVAGCLVAAGILFWGFFSGDSLPRDSFLGILFWGFFSGDSFLGILEKHFRDSFLEILLWGFFS